LPSVVALAFGLPAWAGMTVLLAATLVLLVPLALYPMPADAQRPGIFDAGNDIDDDAVEIGIDHRAWLAGDRAPVIGVPVSHFIASSPVAVRPVITAWHDPAADERAPPRV
jgi:hypothetical protein